MSGEAGQSFEGMEDGPPTRRGLRRAGWIIAALMLGALVIAWLGGDRIASHFIAATFDDLGIPASYGRESQSATQQVLTNLVIGDPSHPDLTAERVEISIKPALGLPVVASMKLIRPRLYGRYGNGKLEFGALDRLISANADAGPGLPDLELELVDGRARIDGPSGAIGVKSDGRGNLKDGFRGILAIAAPRLDLGTCQGRQASLFAQILVRSGKPALSGPLRLAALDCADRAAHLAALRIDINAELDRDLRRASGKFVLDGTRAVWGGTRLERSGGQGTFAIGAGQWRLDARLKGQSLQGRAFGAGQLALEARAEGGRRSGTWQMKGMVRARDLAVGAGLGAGLARWEQAGSRTMVAALARQLRLALASETRGSSLAASFALDADADELALEVPGALLRGASGAHLLALNAAEARISKAGELALSGEMTSGGAGLPRFAAVFQVRKSTFRSVNTALGPMRSNFRSCAC